MTNESLGSYRILHLIGQGGMGAVYAAQHTLIGKRAAVKVLLPELSRDPEMVQRFFNEARSAALIHHPGLVEIFDFGYHPNGSAYLVMEFLDGESVTARLRRDGRLPVPLAAGLGAQVAAAVGAAHAHGIVHRDLKPDNLFLVPDQAVAQRIRVKVLDFGIAKLTTDSGPESLRTRTGALIGTPLYMSPEQCRGAGAIDHRSDIYSLGVILYEMISGVRPFAGNGPGEVLAAHLFQQPTPLRAHDAGIPAAIEAVVMTCLAKDPAHRFQTMEALAAALESASSGVGAFIPTPYPPPQSPYAPAPPTTLGGSSGQVAPAPRRRSTGLWIGLAAVVIAGGAGVGLLAGRGGGGTATTTTTTTTTGGGTVSPPDKPPDKTPDKPPDKPPEKPPEKPPADEACEAGRPEVCARLGLAYEMGRSKNRSFESALGAYLRGCDANVGDACAGLGRLYLNGNGVRREAARALAVNQKACQARAAQGCYQLGDMYAMGTNIPVDHGRALASYETACELGSVGGCMDAGLKLSYGLGVPADPEKGKRLLRRGLELGPGACEAGDVFACERLGIMYFRGHGVEADATRVLALFQRACELGYAMACAELGFLYENGRGIPMDRERAFSLLRASCEGGYNDGCAGLGGQYLRGIGADKDEKRGLALLDGACLKGVGCGARAQAYLGGVGGPVDKVKALEMAGRGCDAGDTNACTWVGELAPPRKTEMNRRACDAGDSGGCLNLGVALWKGGADDKKNAVAFFDKSCSISGGEVGCNWLAFAYLNGEGATKDQKRGLDLLDRACEQSDATSCYEIAMLYARGQHVPKSAGRAADMLDKACVLQMGEACRLLADRYAGGNGVPRNGAHATELRQKACAYGDTVACKGRR